MLGKVAKGIGGFYYVKFNNEIIRGQGRGILKRNNNLIKVGDNVEFELRDDKQCVITKVCKRKNEFIRPSIANIDRIIVTFAATEPNPSFLSIDKLCAIAEYYQVSVYICITKIDLVDENRFNEIINVYNSIYKTFNVNAKSGYGIDELMKGIQGQTVALAGPSGVGKSTILNALLNNNKAETGSLSSKTKRGRHTTRHAEIFDVDYKTSVFDTPGFTSLDMPIMEVSDLTSLFPDFVKYCNCKYRDCIHINEPSCGVKESLSKGFISRSRYQSYIRMIEEIKSNKKY